MSWSAPQTVAFTRLGIVAEVPSSPGVYAILDESACLLVGDAWNLKARLLELINAVASDSLLSVEYIVADESTLPEVRAAVESRFQRTLVKKFDGDGGRPLPGLHLRNDGSQEQSR